MGGHTGNNRSLLVSISCRFRRAERPRHRCGELYRTVYTRRVVVRSELQRQASASLRGNRVAWTMDWLQSLTPDNKVHGTNMGPTWGRQDPGGPHVGPMNFAIWDVIDAMCPWIYNIHHNQGLGARTSLLRCPKQQSILKSKSTQKNFSNT